MGTSFYPGNGSWVPAIVPDVLNKCSNKLKQWSTYIAYVHNEAVFSNILLPVEKGFLNNLSFIKVNFSELGRRLFSTSPRPYERVVGRSNFQPCQLPSDPHLTLLKGQVGWRGEGAAWWVNRSLFLHKKLREFAAPKFNPSVEHV